PESDSQPPKCVPSLRANSGLGKERASKRDWSLARRSAGRGMHGERGCDWIGPKPHAGAVSSPGLSLIKVFGNRKGGSFMVASIGREATIGQLAQLILALERSSPVRVAIDGRTASGKTTFANEL